MVFIITEPFNIRLKKLLVEHNLNSPEEKEKLANDLGISKHTIAKYLTGERQPGYDILSKIAFYFSVSTDYLIGYSDIRNIDDFVLIESLKTKFKNFPSNIIDIIDTVCSIIANKDTVENLDALDAVLKELYKVMKK